jgi:hypothetical protein
MEEHKYIQLIGEVIWRGVPQSIPEKHYKSTYFTVKCIAVKQKADKTREIINDYFSIQTFKESQIEKIREGYIIRCLVRRDGNLWVKNGEIQLRDDFRKQVYYGNYPVVFESYHLIGEIEVVDQAKDREAIRKHNEDFKDDLPF